MRLIVKGLYLRLVLLEMHLCWVGTKEDANGSSFQLRAIAARIGPMPFLCTHYLPLLLLLLPLLLLHSLLVESWSWFLNHKLLWFRNGIYTYLSKYLVCSCQWRLLPTMAHVSKCSFQQRLISSLKKDSWHQRLIPEKIYYVSKMVLPSMTHASNGSY